MNDIMKKNNNINFIDLTGQKINRLIIIRRVNNSQNGRARWLCQCECGNKTIVIGKNLRNGNTKSCGCLRIDCRTKHGHSRTMTYKIWGGIIQRCNNPYCNIYKKYGGRGIKVCETWQNFEGFLRDMGERPSNMSIDRIDNNGNYCKENCRWATHATQRRNREDVKWITINNKTQCLKDWCKQYELNYNTVYGRIYYYGWTPEEALELIPRKKNEI